MIGYPFIIGHYFSVCLRISLPCKKGSGFPDGLYVPDCDGLRCSHLLSISVKQIIKQQVIIPDNPVSDSFFLRHIHDSSIKKNFISAKDRSEKH